MSDSKMSRAERKKKLQTENQILTVVGCGFVIATSIFSVMGTRLAVNNINRDAQDAIVFAQQQQRLNATKVKTDVEDDTTNDNPVTDETKKWSDEQVKWMQENHITYNEHGQPVDENGNVVIDPTVPIAEKTETNVTTDVGSVDVISPEEPETNTNWVNDIDGLTQLENGDYGWTVSSGDSLSKLSALTGFSVQEIADYNGITNVNLIHEGDVIRFPQAGPSGAAASNLGLG